MDKEIKKPVMQDLDFEGQVVRAGFITKTPINLNIDDKLDVISNPIKMTVTDISTVSGKASKELTDEIIKRLSKHGFDIKYIG